MPDAAELVASLGEKLILKPTCNGSSVGLHVIESAAQLGEVLSRLPAGDWLVERRVFGRELTVGVLGGKAMAVVEVAPKSGLYDYTSKYTKGMSTWPLRRFPMRSPDLCRRWPSVRLRRPAAGTMRASTSCFLAKTSRFSSK
jgi:hypothetical protein